MCRLFIVLLGVNVIMSDSAFLQKSLLFPRRPVSFSSRIGSDRSPTLLPPSNERRFWKRKHQCIFTPLFAASASEISKQFGFNDRFDRWRFLQNLLDEDVSAEDTNLVFVCLLDKCLKNKQDLPALTQERIEIMEYLLKSTSARTVHALLEGDSHAQSILTQLEILIPDAEEDEDAMKGLWDTVIELNGRESVKINEKEGTIQWKARCLIARVLLHYDFLTSGLDNTK